MMKFRLRCREASELLSRQQDGTLPVADSARLRLHLVMCDACRNVAEQLAFIRRAMRQLSKEQGPEP
jgi:predicted anti-sigma-YlaC factor YlaD